MVLIGGLVSYPPYDQQVVGCPTSPTVILTPRGGTWGFGAQVPKVQRWRMPKGFGVLMSFGSRGMCHHVFIFGKFSTLCVFSHRLQGTLLYVSCEKHFTKQELGGGCTMIIPSHWQNLGSFLTQKISPLSSLQGR
jgi:hypothetical protein